MARRIRLREMSTPALHSIALHIRSEMWAGIDVTEKQEWIFDKACDILERRNRRLHWRERCTCDLCFVGHPSPPALLEEEPF